MDVKVKLKGVEMRSTNDLKAAIDELVRELNATRALVAASALPE